MIIKTYKAFNPKAMRNVELLQIIDQGLYEIECLLKFISENKPNRINDYISKIKGKLAEYINNRKIKIFNLSLKKIEEELAFIFDYPELVNLCLELICVYLEIPRRYRFDNLVEVLNIKAISAPFILKYFGLKAMADLLGEEEGIELYKKHCQLRYQEGSVEKNPRTAKKARKDQLKEFTENELYDWTFAIFDDEKYLVKVNRCFFHEVFKPFNDPKFAYLTVCYSGSDAVRRDNEYLRMRRTQTLFDGEFCDEFYWNNDVHPDAEQPSVEFVQKLGKEDPAKIIAKYQDKR